MYEGKYFKVLVITVKDLGLDFQNPRPRTAADIIIEHNKF